MRQFSASSIPVFEMLENRMLMSASFLNSLSIDPTQTVSTVPKNGDINPYGVAYNYQTGGLLTINSTSDTSSVIDTQTFKTRATLGISSLSQFPVAMDNFGNTAIIVDQNNNRVIFLAMPK